MAKRFRWSKDGGTTWNYVEGNPTLPYNITGVTYGDPVIVDAIGDDVTLAGVLAPNKTIILSGDSITNFTSGTSASYAGTNSSILGFPTWMNALSGNTLFLPPWGQNGVPGRTAANMAANWTGDILSQKPDIVSLMAGTNDLGTTDNSAAIISSLNTCVTQTLNYGAKMVLIPILPRALGAALNAAAEQARVTVNAWINSQAGPNIAVSKIDGYDPVTMSQGDGLHPNVIGAEVIGRQAAAALATLENPFDILAVVANSPLNLMGSAGLMAGNDPSGVFNGITGSSPASWKQTSSLGGAITAVASVPTNPKGGNWAQLSLSGTTSTGGSGTTLFLNPTQVAIPAGTIITLMGEIEIDAGWQNMTGFSVGMNFNGVSGNEGLYVANYPLPNKDIRNFVIRCQPAIVPEGCTGWTINIQFYYTAGTSVPVSNTFRIGRMAVIAGAPFTTTATAIPVNSALPTVSGTAQVGQTLTVSNGSWTNTPTAYSYIWFVGGSPVKVPLSQFTATTSTYVPVAGDVGKTVKCMVFAKNAGGSGSIFTASTSAVIS